MAGRTSVWHSDVTRALPPRPAVVSDTIALAWAGVPEHTLTGTAYVRLRQVSDTESLGQSPAPAIRNDPGSVQVALTQAGS
jgi:hypothetical protein